tara:strand:- start:942 stop:1280 length:339 start_codon:yes stop_codon:yes gene_type:complete
MTRYLTQKERFSLQKLLEETLEEHGEFVRFKDDWDDGKIAVKLAIATHTVKNTRQATFGKLWKREGAPATATRIIALEAQVAQLQTQMAKLENTFLIDFGGTSTNGETKLCL